MKKIIPFTKDIKFNTKIYEITSISLEHTLTLDDSNEIDGEFIVSGEYKMNDSSINTEPFIQGLPFNITLTDDYDTDKLKIDIDNFKYELINEEILRVDIDVCIEGSLKEKEEIDEEIQPDVIIEARKDSYKDDKNILELTGLNSEEAIDMNEKDLFKQDDEKATEVIKQNDNKVTSIFENFNSSDDNYVSYYVHIVRENDNIDSICTKYKINIDDIKEYNDIDQITLGNKLIIPYINND